MSSFGRRVHPLGDDVVDVSEGFILQRRLRIRRLVGVAANCSEGSGVGIPALVAGYSYWHFLTFKVEIWE